MPGKERNNMEVEMERPMSIRAKKLSNDLVNIINSSCVPAFIVELIVKDLYYNVKLQADIALKEDAKEWESRNVSAMSGVTVRDD